MALTKEELGDCEDEFEYYCDKYWKFSNLLCYFLENGYYPEKKDIDTIKEIVTNSINKESIQLTIAQIKEVLALNPFPYEWISTITNRLVYDEEKKEWVDDPRLYKEWVTWILDTLEEEAKKCGKL